MPKKAVHYASQQRGCVAHDWGLTYRPSRQGRPRAGVCHRPPDVLHGEQGHQARLQAEPDAARDRVRGRDSLEDGHRRRDDDERRGEHMHQERRRRRRRLLEQHVQVAFPPRVDVPRYLLDVLEGHDMVDGLMARRGRSVVDVSVVKYWRDRSGTRQGYGGGHKSGRWWSSAASAVRSPVSGQARSNPEGATSGPLDQ